MSKPSVYLSMPTYGGRTNLDSAMLFSVGASREAEVVWGEGRCSHPEQSFNECWVNGLNRRASNELTHFAMLHSDVVPEPYWLDKLLSIQAETDADMVSVIIPIKGPSGYTSTAVCVPLDDGRGKSIRVISMRQVYQLPPTFGAEQHPGRELLVNTGCFVCRFDRDWCPRVYARARTWISSGAGRGYQAHLFPSDWDFSLQLAKHGCKVLATREVACYHDRPEYTNTRPWGDGTDSTADDLTMVGEAP